MPCFESVTYLLCKKNYNRIIQSSKSKAVKQIIVTALIATSCFIFSCKNNDGKNDSQVATLSRNVQESPAPENNTSLDKQELAADSIGSPQNPGQQDEKKKQLPGTQI